MPFASDELYKGYIRHNLSKFASTVKTMDMLANLPCLTQSDRDEIMAKKESAGNYNAIQLLLDCLKRRENWPDQLISALKSCEYFELASEVEKEYESLKIPTTENHVTPVAASVDVGHSTISNAKPVTQADAEAIPTAIVTVHLAPLPNDFHTASSDKCVSPNRTDTLTGPGLARSAVPVVPDLPATPTVLTDSEAVPHLSHPQTEVVQKSSAVSTPSPWEDLVRRPVQDTNTPNANLNALADQAENSRPGSDQVRDNYPRPELNRRIKAPHTFSATASSAGVDRAANLSSSTSIFGAMREEEYFSKPGILQSRHAQVLRPIVNLGAAETTEEEPYSGDSKRLEISSLGRHQEPEEDYYESQLSSQDEQIIEGRVSEEPPVLNHAGQTRSTQKEKTTTLVENHPIPGITEQEDVADQNLTEGGPTTSYNQYYIPLIVLAGACSLVFLNQLWRLRK